MATHHYCPRCLTTFHGDVERCTNLSCGRTRPDAGWGDVLNPGDVLDRHYVIDEALAVGGAGLTYVARELGPGGEPIEPLLAIKVLYTQRDQGSFLRRLSNEAQILQELNHDNIVECRGFVHRAGHPPYLVTLFERGGSLGDHLQRHGALSPRVAAGILRQVLWALDTAHQRAIVHRDLKPENVLLREYVDKDVIPRVRVADFGIAKVQAIGERLTKHGAFIGTPEFAAPEQFEARSLTPATDVFAAGALLWTLLTNESPVEFSDRMDPEASYDELVAQVPPVLPAHVGSAAERPLIQAIFDGTMQVEPQLRWTIQQVLVALDGLVEGRPRQVLQTLDVTASPPDRRTWQGNAQQDTPVAPEPATGSDPSDDDAAVVSAVVGVGGPLLALAVGLPVVLIVWLVAAWATGWLGPALGPADAVTLDAVVVDAPDAVPASRDLGAATDPQDVAERDRLVGALTRGAASLRDACGLTDALIADVRVSPRGRVRDVEVRSTHPDTQRRCVVRELRALRLARATEGDVTMRISVSF